MKKLQKLKKNNNHVIAIAPYAKQILEINSDIHNISKDSEIF